MKPGLSSVLLVCGQVSVALADPVIWNDNSNAQNTTSDEIVGYIIQLDHTVSFRGPSLHSRVRSAVGDFEVKREFDNQKYFYGLAISFQNNDLSARKSDIEAILSFPDVKKIWPNRIRARPLAVVPQEYATNEHARRQEESVTLPPRFTSDGHINSQLAMTGINKLHDKGVKGKGVKIGILDSGVDYRHPALGGGFGPGYKIEGGFDFVGDDFYNQTPDPSPLATCSTGGHGTHVSGIIGAVDPDGQGFGVVGVAPEASLYMYRVFSCVGGASDDVLIAAMTRAAADGVDIISMSLGGTGLWEADDVFTPIIQELQAQDIVMVMAAGNDGLAGPLMAASPALNKGIIAVGSIDSTIFPTCYSGTDSLGQTFKYCSILPVINLEEGYAVELPTIDQMGDPEWIKTMQDKHGDMSKVFFIYSVYDANIAWLNRRDRNMSNVLIYLPEGDEEIELDPPVEHGNGWDVHMLFYSDGRKIVDGMEKEGDAYKLKFANQTVDSLVEASAGFMSYFSTYGPTYEGSLKPTISAPGRWILSTWPAYDGRSVGRYAVISGTSMATPHVAGCVALIKSSFPQMTSPEIYRLVQSTAKPLEHFSQTYGRRGFLDTAAHQGSGLLRCEVAIRSAEASALSVSEFNLGGGPSTPEAQSITIENKSQNPKTYHFTHQAAGTIDRMPHFPEWKDTTYGWGPRTNLSWIPSDLTYEAAGSVEPEFESVTIPAGGKASVQFKFTPPTANPDKLPIYSGFVTIRGPCEKYTIPYIGYITPTDILDHTDSWYPESVQNDPPAGTPWFPMITATNTYVRDIEIDEYHGQATYNFPAFWIVIRNPSYYIRVDAVPVDTTFVPVTYGYDPSAVLQNATVKPTLNVDELDNLFGVQSYGEILSFAPSEYSPLPVNPGRYIINPYGMLNGWGPWDTTLYLRNGTTYTAPNGDYRILVRALRGTTDWQDPANYDSWLSPVVRLSV